MAFTASDATGSICVIGRGPHARSLARTLSLYADCTHLAEITDTPSDAAVVLCKATQIIYLPRDADGGIVREYMTVSDSLRLGAQWEGGLILLIAGGYRVERLQARREFLVSGVRVADRYAGLVTLTTLLRSVGTLRPRRWKELKAKWQSENAYLTTLLRAARRCLDDGDRDGFRTRLHDIVSHVQDAAIRRTLEDETGHNSAVMKLVALAGELSVSNDGGEPSPGLRSLLDDAYECLMEKTGGRR